MDKNLVPRLFALYCKLLYDCGIYLLKKKSFLVISNIENKFWTLMKDLKVLVKWNLQWNFTCVCTITLNFKFIFSRCHGKLFSVLFQIIIYYILSFKMLLWSNFQYPFFYIFVHNKPLAKFQSITIIRTHVFWTVISENLQPPLLFLVPSLGWEFE